MTNIPLAVDEESYSTRVCRCGAEMARTAENARYAWWCPTCGRRARG